MTAKAKHQQTPSQQTQRTLTFKPHHSPPSRVLTPKAFLQPAKAPEWLEAEKDLDLLCNQYHITAGTKYKVLATDLSPQGSERPSTVYLQDKHHRMLAIPLSKICSCFLRVNSP